MCKTTAVVLSLSSFLSCSGTPAANPDPAKNSAALASGVTARASLRPPNIVFVLVDDLGWTDLSCQGSKYYETPNIDRLAAQGMRFTDAYAACAVCSPTRAAVMTGRYPARTGVTDWIRARFQRGGRGTPKQNPTAYVGGPNRKLLCPPNPFWLESEETTIAELLKLHGYATCHIGKWHLGDDAWYPQHQGFDENHGGCDYGQPPSYFDPYTNRRLAQGIPHLKPRKKGEYLTDRETDEAVSFIRRHKDEPFFLYLAHYAVHTPIQAKKDLTDHYDAKQKTNQKNAKYAAMVHSVDDAMGSVMKALKDNGVTDNTIVVFTSDNGGLLGRTHNAPLRSGKGFPYEGGIRVPLLVKWPGVVKGGTVSNEPVTSVDYFPTLLEATGIALPKRLDIDGVSLVAHLRSNGTKALDRDNLFWHFPHYRGRRVTPYSIIRSGEWKLIKRFEGPTFELYNLAEDLSEQRDLAATMPDRVKQLDRVLMKHLADIGARLPRARPIVAAAAAGSGPRVLLLGDSISIGYTPFVRQMLQGKAQVFRPMRNERSAENCAGTNNGVKQLDRWLAIGGGKWDVIHFNFGLHDLKRVDPDTGKNSRNPEHPHQAPPARYEEQLREIVRKLKATKATLIFATTTPVPPGGVRPYRDVADPARYNAIAKKIMQENGIVIDDLYAFAKPRLAKIQQKINVHFTKEGSRALARQVVQHVQRALRKQ